MTLCERWGKIRKYIVAYPRITNSLSLLRTVIVILATVNSPFARISSVSSDCMTTMETIIARRVHRDHRRCTGACANASNAFSPRIRPKNSLVVGRVCRNCRKIDSTGDQTMGSTVLFFSFLICILLVDSWVASRYAI